MRLKRIKHFLGHAGKKGSSPNSTQVSTSQQPCLHDVEQDQDVPTDLKHETLTSRERAFRPNGITYQR